jgi:hypothetical protein
VFQQGMTALMDGQLLHTHMSRLARFKQRHQVSLVDGATVVARTTTMMMTT